VSKNVIEEGHYGAGPVLVWDSGWFELVGEKRAGAAPLALFKTETLDFVLHGQRLQGRFALVRMKAPPRQWLLIKQHDEHAQPGVEITEQWTTSALTGRTIEDMEGAAAAGELKTYRCEA
jgi:bifunctional non-homologous end joining protein LigD